MTPTTNTTIEMGTSDVAHLICGAASADSGFNFDATIKALRASKPMISDYWNQPAVIAPNNFKFKSLSEWSFNTAIGCGHGCRFCYVPETSVGKQVHPLAKFGVTDPDAEWGQYVFVRLWDEKEFMAKLREAEKTPADKLKPDGNRAVMVCTTTDPYQVIRHSDARRQQELNDAHRQVVINGLERIRDKSTLNVRVLTRSPLAKQDFELFRSFGDRLMFGMSLPTLNNRLAKVYEPNAPSPSQRFATLKAAKEAGLHIFVAVAATYPECNDADLRSTLTAVRDLEALTIFHEPINVRAENVRRIEEHAKSIGVKLQTDVFATPATWRKYAIGQLKMVESIANDLGIGARLHLWPDKELIAEAALLEVENPLQHLRWIRKYHSRISEWPGKQQQGGVK